MRFNIIEIRRLRNSPIDFRKIDHKRAYVMKSKLLQDENGLKTFALVFDKDEEVKESLIRFAVENGLLGGQVTAHWRFQ